MPIVLKERKALIYIAIGVILLGSGPIFVKSVQAHGVLVGFYRLFFASLMLALPAWRLNGRDPSISVGSDHEWIWSALGGITFAANIALWCSALNYTTASAVTLLDNTAPVWVGLISWLALGQKQIARYWLGLLVTLGGAALMIGMDALRSMTAQMTGNLIALASGLTYAFYIMVTSRARQTLSSLQYSFRVSAIGAVSLLVVSLGLGLFGEPLPLRSYVLIFIMALTSQVIAWLLVNHALGVLPAAAASIALVGQPLVSTILGMLLINEVPTPLQAAGGALCLAGILLVQFSGKSGSQQSSLLSGVE
jgi:drug/metabolite transporter (DMT)-like permease